MIIPPKLEIGDQIQVISPSISYNLLEDSIIESALTRLTKLGYKVILPSKCADNLFTIESRVAELEGAFLNPNVKAIFTAIGGFYSNQILEAIDYEIIQNNPKIICGFSDVTALTNAIYAKTGLVTYSGPHFSTFAMKEGFEYIQNYFEYCLCVDKPFIAECSEYWQDNSWFYSEQKQIYYDNEGLKAISYGEAIGNCVGGNLRTLCSIADTEYMPSLKDAILFIEDDNVFGGNFLSEFLENLQKLMALKDFVFLKAIVIGRFNLEQKIALLAVTRIVETFEILQKIPVVYGADFGHTSPIFTFPIGGRVKIVSTQSNVSIEIIEH